MLTPWKESYTNLDSILKSRDITLPTKVHLVKAMIFPVVMYACANWTIKKAEHKRIYTIQLWCWRRLLRVPRAARRSNQSALSAVNPEYSLEGLMLKLWYFGHLIWGTDSLEKTLMRGKIDGRRRTGTIEDEMVGWHHQLDGHEFEQAPGVGDRQRGLACCSPWRRKESDMTEQLNWTEGEGGGRYGYQGWTLNHLGTVLTDSLNSYIMRKKRKTLGKEGRKEKGKEAGNQ